MSFIEYGQNSPLCSMIELVLHPRVPKFIGPHKPQQEGGAICLCHLRLMQSSFQLNSNRLSAAAMALQQH
eukprot:1594801-Amphidinium_carterae.1